MRRSTGSQRVRLDLGTGQQQWRQNWTGRDPKRQFPISPEEGSKASAGNAREAMFLL